MGIKSNPDPRALWRARAVKALEEVASELPVFIALDIWNRLRRDYGETPQHTFSMGSVIIRAAEKGICRPAGYLAQPGNKLILQWRSTICREVVA